MCLALGELSPGATLDLGSFHRAVDSFRQTNNRRALALLQMEPEIRSSWRAACTGHRVQQQSELGTPPGSVSLTDTYLPYPQQRMLSDLDARCAVEILQRVQLFGYEDKDVLK